MTWNYRIVERVNKPTKRNGLKEPVVWYAVHEVFYHKHGRKFVADSRTLEPDAIIGDNREEILEQLEMIIKDINRSPILVDKEIGCKKKSCKKRFSYSFKRKAKTIPLEKFLESIKTKKGEKK